MVSRNLILHLSLIDTIGPAVIQAIITQHVSGLNASDFYTLSAADWKHLYHITPRTAQIITKGLQDKKIYENELHHMEQKKVEWITIIDDTYPALLREIHLPPSVLYWYGTPWNTIKKTIAVVGSRAITNYGKSAVEEIVPQLITHGWTIVSGGAIGVDTAVHKATIDMQGKTVAILGSGLSCVYPSSNRRLFELIVECGGIVASPFSLHTEPLPGNFPARNRIISGLSQGVIVVQAAVQSGALITARYALDEGREVFAVPGPFNDALSAGCNTLIQSGAKLVMSGGDILNEFGEKGEQPLVHHISHVKTTQQSATSVQDNLSEIQRKIVALCRVPLSCDDIAHHINLTLADVQIELFDLQIAGKINQDFSGMWIVAH